MSAELATTDHSDGIEVLPSAVLAPPAANIRQLSRQEQLAELRAEAEFLKVAYGLAEQACGTAMVAAHFRGKPADGAIAIAYGSSLGWSWTKSLQDVYVVNGKPSIQSKEIRELLITAGHEIWEEEVGPEKVVLAGRRCGSDLVVRVEWTMAKAEKAKLTKNPNYALFPENMLYARCTTDLGKRLAPDALSGLSSREELQDLAYIESDRPASAEKRPPTQGRGVAALADRYSDRGPAVVEAPGPEVSPPDDPARKKNLTALGRLLKKVDVTGAEDALIVTRKLVGRDPQGAPITSSADLTDAELDDLVVKLTGWEKAGTLGGEVTEILNAATLADCTDQEN